jgi:hypothetical protein
MEWWSIGVLLNSPLLQHSITPGKNLIGKLLEVPWADIKR